MSYINETSVGSFKIILEDCNNNYLVINALQKNNITESIPHIQATQIYCSDSNIYIKIVSDKYNCISQDTILKIKKNIQKIIKYKIINFSFSEKKYYEYIAPIEKEIIQKEDLTIRNRLYKYFLG